MMKPSESPPCIAYVRGMKYQLVDEYSILTPIRGTTIIHDYFVLREDGLLTIRRGYAWNGASGPTYDSKSSMRGSLVHDVFCQAMRLKLLDFKYAPVVHEFFRQICIEDGMWHVRAAVWHKAVVFADGGNPEQGPDRPVLYAPRCKGPQRWD